ncbi:MAG: TonB-dependent receptor [Gammaproteobacteria bacterium]|nr:TonB-dependent receptor [Gammaproteobacteria bacterium]
MSIQLQPKHTVLSAAVALSVAGAPVAAQEAADERVLDEIVVTARRVQESLQDVPLAVTALDTREITELGVTNFADYVLQLPNVTAGGSGPGQNTIYIRGVASTTPNLTVAGVAGLAPNVAFYLDEQPLAHPGRNLDVYAADLARIEVLSGPQGTLYGASSQAGNVRLITNKPDLSEFYGNAKLGANTISGGDTGSSVEVMLNVPLSDNFGLRGVFYNDSKGGWIDNVAGTRDTSESARFRPAGTVRRNGVPVASYRAGFQAVGSASPPQRADLSSVTFLTADNSDIVDDDINGVTYTGGRISAQWDITNNWDLLVAHTTQDTEADGVFFADPDVGELEISRFTDERIEDTIDNTAWTLTGRLNALEVIYTGAFTDRQSDQVVDYSDYLFVGQYLPYYICDYSATYVTYNPGNLPFGTCQPPVMYVNSLNKLEIQTHEIRFTTDQANRWRLQGGLFTSELELIEVNDFIYPGALEAISWNAGAKGFAPNYPLTNPGAAMGNPAGAAYGAGPGYYTYPGPFGPDRYGFDPGVVFRNDIRRTDEQFGVFGEFGIDLSERFSLTIGARNYEIEVDLEGSANASFSNFRGPDGEDQQRWGTNISQQFMPGNAVGAPDKAVADGTIYKVTLDWRPQPEQLYYVTWSEGFRPGLLNRPGGRPSADGSGFVVPFELETDEVVNVEVGMKADFGNAFRLNAALFNIDIDNLQTTIFDTSIVNLFFSDNAADARVRGLEADFVWLPPVDGLTIAGALSFLDSEITRKITPTNDVREGDELAFAPSNQGNLRARYEWTLQATGWTAHVMPMISWSADSYSDIITINRDLIDSWTMLSLTAGVASDDWSVTLYGSNLTDKRAEVSRSFVFDRSHVTYAQPRTFGVRASVNF